MKVTTSTIRIERYSPLEEVEFRIPVEQNAKLADIIISGLYQSGTRWIAELTANAYDACPNHPPYIHLPTLLEPWFEVRDQGPGMSPEFMRNRYTSIFYSSKDNDDTAIGGWGLGRLSALAVADSYTVISTYQGTTDTWLVFKGENKMPRLAHLSSQPGTRSGVTVRIDVDMKKINDVVSQAGKMLRFYKPRPLSNVPLPSAEVIFEGEGWSIVKGEGHWVVMGGYCYPVTDNDLREHGYGLARIFESNNYTKNPAGIVFTAPLGACDITTNRENLKITPKTLAYLKAQVNVLTAVVRVDVQKQLDACSSAYEASKLWYSGLSSIQVINHALQSPRYKDVFLSHSIYLNDLDQQISGIKGRSVFYTTRRRQRSMNINDLFQLFKIEPGVKSPLIRIATYLESTNTLHSHRNIVIRSDHLSKFLDQDPILVSTLPEPEKLSPTPREAVQLRFYDAGKFVLCSREPQPGDLYVKLKNNSPEDPQFEALMNNVLYRPGRIFGVPTTYKGDISMLVPLRDRLCEMVLEHIISEEFETTFPLYNAVGTQECDILSRFCSDWGSFEGEFADPVFKRIFNIFSYNGKHPDPRILKLAQLLNLPLNLDPEPDLVALEKYISEKYPMIWLLYHSHVHVSTQHTSIIQEYIKCRS